MATFTVAMALPYTHRLRAHTEVEIVVQRISKARRLLLRSVTGCMSLFLFIIIAWRMTVYARTMAQSGEVSMNLELPEYVVIYLVAFCFVIACLRILVDTLRDARRIKDVK
jgi:TRAP-type C4-dicarboxylate transport system permease small subunit